MNDFTATVVILLLITALLGLGIRAITRWQVQQRTRQLSHSLAVCHKLFAALEHIPAELLSRDLRKGLVLLATHHTDRLQTRFPKHPQLSYLQRQIRELNRIPSGLSRRKLRSKQARKQTTLALEALVKLLSQAMQDQAITQKTGDLARAAAMYAAQQLALDNARQAAKDAEHINAYARALHFAHQAQALCRQLPPLLRENLSETIDADVARLEQLQQQSGVRTAIAR